MQLPEAFKLVLTAAISRSHTLEERPAKSYTRPEIVEALHIVGDFYDSNVTQWRELITGLETERDRLQKELDFVIFKLGHAEHEGLLDPKDWDIAEDDGYETIEDAAQDHLSGPQD